MTKTDITPSHAREFFLYMLDDEAIGETYCKMIGAEVGSFEARIDWGRNEAGDLTGGDIWVGPLFRCHQLPDDELVELASLMGASGWTRPAWPAWQPAQQSPSLAEHKEALAAVERANWEAEKYALWAQGLADE